MSAYFAGNIKVQHLFIVFQSFILMLSEIKHGIEFLSIEFLPVIFLYDVIQLLMNSYFKVRKEIEELTSQNCIKRRQRFPKLNIVKCFIKKDKVQWLYELR